MILQELIGSQDINEIRMDPSSLARATKDIDARVGIEFEMVVPGSGGGDDFEPEPDYDYDRRPRNLGDVLDFFNDGDYNSRREIARLERDLTEAYSEDTIGKFDQAWGTNGISLISDWLANNVKPEDIMSILGLEDQDLDVITREQLNQAAERVWEIEQEPYYEQARDQAQEEYFEDSDIDSWVRSEYRNMSDISDSFTISWPFWTQYDPDEDDSRQMIADEFSEAVGRPVILSDRYQGGARDDKSYVIEPDSSISAGSDELGLEFISPPLPLNEIIKDIEAIKKWANRVGAYTNKSTGLHMNISIPNLNDQNLDYVKLAVLLGDEYVLKQFGREANTYTVSALKQIQDRVKKLDTTAMEKYLDQIKSGLNKRASELLSISGFGKYTSINPKSGYIEFRSPGGDYLNEPTDKLVNTLQRFIVATKSAIDPDADRREYISKLTRLLTPPKQTPTDTIQYFARYSAGELPKSALKSFIKQTQLQRQAQRQQLAAGQKIEWEVSKRSDINNPNRNSLRVVAASESEAREQATTSGMGWTWLDPDQLIARPAPPRANVSGLPPPELNGRPSNPDGNAYIATIQQPDTPLYRFMAADGDDARTVLDQWERTYGGNYVWRPDPRQERGQPAGSAQSQPPASTPSQSSYPSLNLTAPESNPDANYAIIRNSDNAVIEYYTRNTPIEAFRAYSRWLRTMGDDLERLSDIYRYEPVRPYVSSQPQSVQWRILVDGEEVHRFWNRNNQGEANSAARDWILDQIRRGLLAPHEGAEVEVVPVTNN